MQVDTDVAAYISKHNMKPIVPVLSPFDEQPFKATMLASHDRYNDLIKNRGKLGVPSGIKQLDADSGGFKPGQMTIVAGETGFGKSTVAVNIANAALKNGDGVALFTLEMDKDEITDMLVSINCSVNRNAFNTGYFTESDMANIVAKTAELAHLPFYIDDAPMMTAEQIRSRVMELVSEEKIKLAIVDYAQIVSPADQRQPREQQVALIARELRALAKEARIPLIVLSQLNDEGKLRESRVLAHEAHNVCQIEPTDAGLNLKIYKGRRIPKKTYELVYEPQYCRISSPKPKPVTETNPKWKGPE